MKNKPFMITISLALIVAGLLGILSLVKVGGINGAKACALNQSISSSCTAVTGGSITGGVIGTLQSGGIITGIVALFVVALGAVILINTMKSQE
jgi:hypothetical protein